MDEEYEEALDLEGDYEMKEFWYFFRKNLKDALKVYFAIGAATGLIALIVVACSALMAVIGAFYTIVVLVVFVTILSVLVGTALDMYWKKKGYR